MRFRSLFVAAALTVLPLSANAASTACPANFFRGNAPDVLSPVMQQDTFPICYHSYGLLYSGKSRTPLWSAENLTTARIESARETHRVNDFHPDPNLPEGVRSELSDYSHSGYDRGHNSPSGDSPDAQSQDETFSLANMMPQNPDDNRKLWADIEAAVRKLAMADGDVYVVTGPVFKGARIEALRGRVLVPTNIYKAIYDPARNQAGAYLVDNAPGDAWQELTIDQLIAFTGIDPFPGLPASVKRAGMNLPFPSYRGRQDGIPPVNELPDVGRFSQAADGQNDAPVMPDAQPGHGIQQLLRSFLNH